MPRQFKPDYWELFYNKKNELCFHLCDGNNHEVLLSGEGYRNPQACLKLLYDRKQHMESIDYYPHPISSVYWVEVYVSKEEITLQNPNGDWIERDRYYLIGAGNGKRVKLRSPKKLKK